MDGHAETVQSQEFWPETDSLWTGNKRIIRHFDPDSDGDIRTPRNK